MSIYMYNFHENSHSTLQISIFLLIYENKVHSFISFISHLGKYEHCLRYLSTHLYKAKKNMCVSDFMDLQNRVGRSGIFFVCNIFLLSLE